MWWHVVKHGVESGVFFGVEFGVSFGVEFVSFVFVDFGGIVDHHCLNKNVDI